MNRGFQDLESAQRPEWVSWGDGRELAEDLLNNRRPRRGLPAPVAQLDRAPVS